MLNKLRNRKKKGFTLIELIVVLVIMVILAAAAIPTILGYIENSRKAAYLSNMRTVYTSTQTAITEALANGQTITDVTTKISTSGNTTIADRVKELTGIAVVASDTAQKKDTYVVTIANNKVTKIVAYYQDNKSVTLEPGVGSDVMDTASTSQA